MLQVGSNKSTLPCSLKPKIITKILRAQSEKLIGIVFPVELDKISKFENQNQDIAVTGTAQSYCKNKNRLNKK